MRSILSYRTYRILATQCAYRVPRLYPGRLGLPGFRSISDKASVPAPEASSTPSVRSQSGDVHTDGMEEVSLSSNDQGIVQQTAEMLAEAHQILSWDERLFGWGVTLALSGIAVRTISMPLLYYNQLHHARAAATTQEIRRIQAYLKTAPGSLLQKFRTFRRLRKIALRAAGTSPAKLYPWYFFVNAPLFICSSLAVRKIALEGPESWHSAGIPGWCVDLSAADPTGALPIISTAIWLWNAHRRSPKSGSDRSKEQGMSGGQSVNAADSSTSKEATSMNRKNVPLVFNGDAMTTLFQGLAVFSYPFITGLPSGMFIFWISSGLTTALQRSLLTSNYGRRIVGLPTFAELQQASKSPGPPVLEAASGAVRAVRAQLEYVQREVLASFAGRRVDETLLSDVNRTLRREFKRRHIGLDLEAVLRKDGDTGRSYVAVIRRGTA